MNLHQAAVQNESVKTQIVCLWCLGDVQSWEWDLKVTGLSLVLTVICYIYIWSFNAGTIFKIKQSLTP